MLLHLLPYLKTQLPIVLNTTLIELLYVIVTDEIFWLVNPCKRPVNKILSGCQFLLLDLSAVVFKIVCFILYLYIMALQNLFLGITKASFFPLNPLAILTNSHVLTPLSCLLLLCPVLAPTEVILHVVGTKLHW